jgi:hypothetical protein
MTRVVTVKAESGQDRRRRWMWILTGLLVQVGAI